MRKESYIDQSDDWVASHGNAIPEDAFVGGYDGEDLYIGKALATYGCFGSLIPGKKKKISPNLKNSS